MAEIKHFGDVPRGSFTSFVQSIPPYELGYFGENVGDPAVVASWADSARSIRLVAVTPGGAVCAYLAIVVGAGWASHVGDLRLVVAPGHRRNGLGRALSRRGLVDALSLDLRKVCVSVPADDPATVALFEDIGFEAEALLRDHIRRDDGQVDDLMMLSYFVQERQNEMMTLGFDLAVRAEPSDRPA